MAKPRVFVSSTYYDLKYVRSPWNCSLAPLGLSLFFSSTGALPSLPTKRSLDESCYREAQNCDIYVLIIGGRYGWED